MCSLRKVNNNNNIYMQQKLNHLNDDNLLCLSIKQVEKISRKKNWNIKQKKIGKFRNKNSNQNHYPTLFWFELKQKQNSKKKFLRLFDKRLFQFCFISFVFWCFTCIDFDFFYFQFRFSDHHHRHWRILGKQKNSIPMFIQNSIQTYRQNKGKDELKRKQSKNVFSPWFFCEKKVKENKFNNRKLCMKTTTGRKQFVIKYFWFSFFIAFHSYRWPK